jgi:hypothetical protein
VSKIYHAGGVLYAIGALTKDAGRGYSPADIVAALVQKSPSFPELLANLKTVLSRSLQDELTRLRAEEPLSFQDAIKAGTTVLLGCFENGEPVAIVIGFRGIVGPDGQLRITTTQLACPGDCPIDKPYIFWVGSHNAIARYLARHGKDFSAMLPEAGAKFLVKIEIDAKTPGVGPPVDVAQVSKNGVEWLSRKGQKKR